MNNWQCILFSMMAHALVLGWPVAAVVRMENKPEPVRLIILKSRTMPKAPETASALPGPAQTLSSVPQSSQKSVAVQPTVTPVRTKTGRKADGAPAVRKTSPPRPKVSDGLEPPTINRQSSPPVAFESPAAPPPASVHAEAGPTESPEPVPIAAAMPSIPSARIPSGPVETRVGVPEGPGFLKRISPRYPRLARRMGLEGTVVLRLDLDASGRLRNVEVVSGAGTGFDEEAVHAIRQSTFSPAVRQGRPVDSLALLTIRFQLTEME